MVFAPVATVTSWLIRAVVPALIPVALSPAIATLVRRALAGRFAAAVVGWYVGRLYRVRDQVPIAVPVRLPGFLVPQVARRCLPDLPWLDVSGLNHHRT